LALTIWTGRLQAQSTDVSTPPPGSTTIDSDEMRADQENHTAVFTGNVIVTGSNFTMRCHEMTVYTKDGKIDHIVATADIAKGGVVIQQPGRISHSGQAEYFRDDDRFVLTDQPIIIDNKNQIEAPKITIYRSTQQMITEGPTKVTLVEGIGSSASSNASPSTPSSTGK
jgi:lipopolysaccharide transport protein LptA